MLAFFVLQEKWAFAFSASLVGRTYAVIDISAFAAQTNDRFVNDESFSANAYDFQESGVMIG